jgi:GNAT superfamily N-acetyltransferase
VTIRSATAADFDAVTALLVELGRPPVTDATDAAARRVFDEQVADELAGHLVAVNDAGRVVGFCSLHFRTRLNHPTLEAWVPDLIVAEDVRGTGVGGQLLVEAERRARARGCHGLTLESAYFRTRAHSFYLAAEMTDSGKSFWKSLA